MDSKPLLSNGLKTQSVADSNKCTIKSTVKEEIDGCKFALFSPYFSHVGLADTHPQPGLDHLPGYSPVFMSTPYASLSSPVGVLFALFLVDDCRSLYKGDISLS